MVHSPTGGEAVGGVEDVILLHNMAILGDGHVVEAHIQVWRVGKLEEGFYFTDT